MAELTPGSGLLPITELINYFCERLQEHPPLPRHAWKEICQSTLVYLNSYRQLQGMLDKLAGKEKGERK